MPGRKIRRDGLRVDGGSLNVAWGCRVPDVSPTQSEALVMLYSLTARPDLPTPIKYLPHMTHEVVVYGLDSSVPIDFTRSLWEQKELIPAEKPVVGFQFKAESDASATHRVQCVLDKVRIGEARVSFWSDWNARFPDAVDIGTPLIEPNDPAVDLEVLDDDELYVGGASSPMAKRAHLASWATLARVRNAAAWTFGISAACIMVAGSIMPAMDFVESMGIPVPGSSTIVRTLEFEGGRKMVVKLTRKFGESDHYVAELVSVEAAKPDAKAWDITY